MDNQPTSGQMKSNLAMQRDVSAEFDSLALLDFGASGIRSAVSVGGSFLPVPVDDLGLSPDSLVTVRQAAVTQSKTFELPFFPALLDRVGEDALVMVDELVPEKPHVHLQNLMAATTAGLRKWWGPKLEELGILVPTYTTEPQRDWIVKAARATGWKRTHLVNKTTALAVRALDGRLDGNYLIGVFGHGPADLSIVQWRSGRVRPLTHVSAANLSGSQLDRVVLVGALGRLMEQQRNVVDPMLLSDLDWLWLQRNVESTRRSLCTHDRVTLELPSSMTDGQALELEFDRETVRQQVRSVIMEFTAVLRQCCTEANLGVEQLQGCLVSGGLLWQLDVLDQLNEQCGNLPVIPYPPDAQMLGAHRRIAAILTETTQPESEGTPVNSKPLPKLEHRHIACGTTFPIDQKHDQPSEPSLDAFVQRISDLIRSGKSDEAKVELRPLQECIHTLESSLASAEQARSAQSETDRLLGLARTVTIVSSGQPEAQIIATDDSPEQSLEIPPRGDSATPPVAPVAKAAESKDEKSAKRAERRKYIRAKEELKKAQDALNKGQLEQAVGLSHAAYEQSADHRIFDAMIKVHLIAASKRPPHDSNFADERRWLLCALNDDTTREDTQQAIADRYKIHVRQLVDMGTREARRHAIEMLRDLSNVIPMPELAEHWLQILKEATSEKVQLPEEVPGASA